MPLAVNAGEVASPLLSVVAVAVVLPPEKVPPAPLDGAVNVTVALGGEAVLPKSP